jgi:hypothetical protein
MAAETQFTANTGMVSISTANSNLDGTGTLGTVLTAASNGTDIKSITIKSTVTTTEGMVRLFLDDGNGNIRLIEEVHVYPNTVSATNPAFEFSFDCDYKLKSGWILKAATQNAENFNIIAEGLNWAYYTAAVRPESTNYTANNGAVVISTANSNRDGTGSLGTVITAGASATYKGCKIESLTIKATGNTTTGTVRLFLYDGTNTKLLTELRIPAVTQTSTEPAFEQTIDLGNFHLQAGWLIKASTENAESFAVSAEANDWKYPTDSFITNYTAVSGTSVTTEELLHSLQVPANLFASGGLLEVYSALTMTNNANTKTFRIYFNTTNALAGATLVATLIDSNFATDGISRFFPILSDTSVACYGGPTNSLRASYGGSTGASTTVTVPSVSAGFWVLISCQKAVAGDTDTIVWTMVTRRF